MAAEADGGALHLMDLALSSARDQLSDQSKRLQDAQSRVEQLVTAQKRLHTVLGLPRKPSVAAATVPDDALDGVGLRALLGASVRREAEQQGEMVALREQLCKERDLTEKQRIEQRQLHGALVDAQETAESLERELSSVREEARSEKASLEGQLAELQQKIDEMEAAEKTRLALEEAMGSGLPEPPSAPSIAVAAPPPPPPPAYAAAGGFEL